MEKFSTLNIEELIKVGGFDCACKKTHKADTIKLIKTGSGAIGSVAEVVKFLGKNKPFIITDPNEYEVAGKTVFSLLETAGFTPTIHVVPCEKGKRVAPSEWAMGSIGLNFPADCDIIVAVGSGVINDLCKCTAKMTGRQYIIVGTAPSMDGYASDNASMEVNNVKLSLPEVMPSAIILDTDILAKAPMRMLWSGLGDMIGKFSALCEWKLANIITGEYYCDEIASLMNESLKKIMSSAKGVTTRNPDSIKAIADGLVLSGIAIAFAGVSRPASGQEHYFSHCWEMLALSRGTESDFHGIQVALGTLYTAKLYEKLKTIHPTMDRVYKAIEEFDEKAWEEKIRKTFSSTAEDILLMEKKAGKNLKEGRLLRAKAIIDNWDKILSVLDELAPDYNKIKSLMEYVGMPTTAEETGLTHEDVLTAFVHSRDIRNKYLLSSMIWDIGYAEEFTDFLDKV